MTNNLGRTVVAAGQGSNVFTAINDADGVMDARLTAVLTLTVDSSNAASLTTAQMKANATILLSADSPAPDGAVTVTVAVDSPAVPTGHFVVINQLAQDVTVTISGQSETAPVVYAGKSAHLISDGSDIRYASSQGVRSADVSRIVETSQAAYDALSPVDSATLYLITS